MYWLANNVSQQDAAKQIFDGKTIKLLFEKNEI